MREWTLTAADPIAPRIAADARSGRTTYNDDQIWQLRLGLPQEPALALETRYGGRVGLARLVPIWSVGRRQIYETQAYHQPPVISALATDYLRLRAGLTASIELTMEFWVMESQAIGGRFTLRNTADTAQSIQLHLTAQAAREEQELQKFFLTLETGDVALQTFRLRHLQPVLLLEGAGHSATKAQLSRVMDLPPGESLSARFVLASLPERDLSLGLAYRWIADPDWDAAFRVIAGRADAAPDIRTGSAEHDAALAWSQQFAVRSFLDATGHLPHPSFVRSRKTNQGYAVSGMHASGFSAPWGGQSMFEALHIAASVALCAPELAKGMVRNFLAVQREDGWIDARPGLDGQRANVIAPPLLGTLALTVYEFTGDRALLADALDGAFGLLERWFQLDHDRNGDGLPEWSHVAQGPFADSPTLAEHRRWAEGVDVTTLNAPDLVAYLGRELHSLARIAELLERDDITAELAARRAALSEHLDELWDAQAGRFTYQDRDTRACPAGDVLLAGKGDESFDERTDLPAGGRLVLRVYGGLSRKPRMSCTVEGINAEGQATHEDIQDGDFSWYRGSGSASTRTVWRTITHLKFSGLSRVFNVEVRTSDLTRADMSQLMPLWSGLLDETQIERLISAMTDPDQYGRVYGISGCPVTDPAYDPLHRNGCGGMWPEWNARLARALIDLNRRDLAADLYRRVLAAQIMSLREKNCFRRLYNPDSGEGMGDADDLFGIVSLEWFARLFGAWVLNPGSVAIRGPFALGETNDPVTWTQHGATITRSAAGTQIVFVSGHTVELPPEAEPQVVRDPSVAAAVPRQEPPERDDDGLLPDGV